MILSTLNALVIGLQMKPSKPVLTHFPQSKLHITS